MRKFLVIVLAVALLFGGASYLMAEPHYSRSGNQFNKTEVRTGSTDAALSTNVIAGKNILGMTYADSSAGIGVIWDSATVAGRSNSTNIIAEASCSAGSTETVIFPLPYKVENGLVMLVENTTGVMTIYYE